MVPSDEAPGAPSEARHLSSAVPSGIAIAVFQPSSTPLTRVALAVATAGGVGLLPAAPGTFGAAVAVAIFVLSSPLVAAGAAALGPGAVLGLWAAAWVALLVLGAWAAEVTERAFGRKDDGRIVIDEVVGQLATLAPLLPAVLAGGAPGAVGAAGTAGAGGVFPSALGLVTGFVAFRVFDVWKPGPVRGAERLFRGGIGVMMDDVVAGLFGAAVVGALVALGAFAP